MYFATKSRRMQILVWLIWAITGLVFILVPEQTVVSNEPVADPSALAGVVTHDPRDGPLFP
jgi:threonine/homoserine efflux transporter RhtA